MSSLLIDLALVAVSVVIWLSAIRLAKKRSRESGFEEGWNRCVEDRTEKLRALYMVDDKNEKEWLAGEVAWDGAAANVRWFWERWSEFCQRDCDLFNAAQRPRTPEELAWFERAVDEYRERERIESIHPLRPVRLFGKPIQSPRARRRSAASKS